MILLSPLIALLIFLGFYLIGARLCSRWRPEFLSLGEAWPFCTLLGLVAVSVLTTLLAFLHWIYPATGWLLLAGIYGTGLPELRRLLERLRNPAEASAAQPAAAADPWLRLILSLLAVFVVLALTLALAPPVRTDALVYHLAIPKAYLAGHGFVNLPNNMYSFFPMLFSMLYLFAMTFGIESLPALMGLGASLLLLAGLAAYFRHHLKGSYGILAAAIFFSTPTFWEIAASAYIDVPLAGFMFFTFYAWDRWRTTHHPAWFLFMTVFAAAALATKLTAFIVLPLVVLGIALEGRHHNRPALVLGRLVVFGLTVLLFMAPWWLKNYLYSGNPFTPLFMQFLGGSDRVNWDPNRALMMDTYVKWFGMGRGWQDILLLPYNLTFYAEPDSLRFDGRTGPVYFALLPFLLALWGTRSASLRALGFCTLSWLGFWFIYFQYVRFLTPALAFLSVLTAIGLERITRRPAGGSRSLWQNAILTAVLGLLAANLVTVTDTWLRRGPVAYLSGLEDRDQYLERNVPPYTMYRVMNRELPPDARVLFVYMRNLGYLAEREFISDSVFEAHTLQTLLAAGPSVAELARRFRERGITHLMFDNNYVFGRDSGFAPEVRPVLKEFLETRCRKVAAKNGFFLFAFMVD